jgi:phage protein U
MFAALGEITFLVLTSFENFRSTSGYRYAEHKVVEAPPRLQWIGDELEKISIDMRFHAAFTNPAIQMLALHSAAQDHQARALVFGNGVFRGYFVIESLEETHSQLADDGSYIAIEARLELHEWVPGADFDPLAPPQLANPPSGIVQGGAGFQPAGGGQAGMPVPQIAGLPQVFNPSVPISPTNELTPAAVTQLGLVGAIGGVSYSPVAYAQPGVSGIASAGPAPITPGNPSDVPTSTIVRAG